MADTDFRLAEFARNNESMITSALRVYAEQMDEAATASLAAFEAGRANAEVKAAQDGSLLTNNGLRHSTQLFVESAEKARKVARELQELTDEEGF